MRIREDVLAAFALATVRRTPPAWCVSSSLVRVRAETVETGEAITEPFVQIDPEVIAPPSRSHT